MGFYRFPHRLSICIDAFACRGGKWELVCFDRRSCLCEQLRGWHAVREFMLQNMGVNAELAKTLRQPCQLDRHYRIDEGKMASQEISAKVFVDGGEPGSKGRFDAIRFRAAFFLNHRTGSLAARKATSFLTMNSLHTCRKTNTMIRSTPGQRTDHNTFR